MTTKVLSLSPLAEEILYRKFRQYIPDQSAQVDLINGNTLTDQQIIETHPDTVIILADYSGKRAVTQTLASSLPNLRLIQTLSVGYQHIDIQACQEAGICVANTHATNAVSVAEYCIMGALNMLRQTVPAHQATAAGKWAQQQIQPVDLMDKTWGMIGMGAIGKALSQRLRVFDLNLLYFSRTQLPPEEEQHLTIHFTSLEELISKSDIVSLHCPLTAHTRHLFSHAEFAQMKKTATIINVSRGPVIDESALVEALQQDQIGGAVLDVFTEEPLPKDHPLLQIGPQKLLLSPHLAGATREAKTRIMSTALENIGRFLQGKSIIHQVDY